MLYHKKSLKVREELGDSNEIAGSFTNIGNIFTMQENYEKALNFAMKALKIYEELKKSEASDIRAQIEKWSED